MTEPQGRGAEGWAPAPRPRLLDLLTDDPLREVLKRLVPAAVGAVACCSKRLASLAGEDALWRDLVHAQLPHAAALLESGQPEWWAGASWRQRLHALATGATFQAQVYNREPENEAEDFLLSAYDATVWLPPASARTLLRGGGEGASDSSSSSSGSSGGGGGSNCSSAGAGSNAASPAADASCTQQEPPPQQQQQQEVLFSARYLPMGGMKAAEEAGVAAARLRLPPRGSSPHAVYGGDGGAAFTAGLSVGEEVEVQWKGRRCHPYGWWFGTVQSVRGNRVVLLFRQYPRSSVWHRVRAPIKPGAEAVVNGDWTFGYVGGLRRLAEGERKEWRRHGAPHPPAPAALQALAEEAAEEDWSDEEELDIDMELAAELEEEEGLLLPPAGEDAAGGAAAGHAAPEVDAAAGAGGLPAEDAAAVGPAAPPVEPIAMQLGAAAAAAAAAAEGLPVELAGAPNPAAEPAAVEPGAAEPAPAEAGL